MAGPHRPGAAAAGSGTGRLRDGRRGGSIRRFDCSRAELWDRAPPATLRTPLASRAAAAAARGRAALYEVCVCARSFPNLSVSRIRSCISHHQNLRDPARHSLVSALAPAPCTALRLIFGRGPSGLDARASWPIPNLTSHLHSQARRPIQLESRSLSSGSC